MSQLEKFSDIDGWHHTSTGTMHFFKKSEAKDGVPVSICGRVDGNNQGIEYNPARKNSKKMNAKQDSKRLGKLLRQYGCKLCLQKALGVKERPVK